MVYGSQFEFWSFFCLIFTNQVDDSDPLPISETEELQGGGGFTRGMEPESR